MEKTDEHFMRLALKEAEMALSENEIPIGAVIVANGKVIARAHNQTEMLDITAAANQLGGKYLSGCTLYVTVEPCVMCAGAIGWAQLSRIVYGCGEEKRGFSRFAPQALHPRATITAGVLENDCKAVMQDFFKRKRK